MNERQLAERHNWNARRRALVAATAVKSNYNIDLSTGITGKFERLGTSTYDIEYDSTNGGAASKVWTYPGDGKSPWMSVKSTPFNGVLGFDLKVNVYVTAAAASGSAELEGFCIVDVDGGQDMDSPQGAAFGIDRFFSRIQPKKFDPAQLNPVAYSAGANTHTLVGTELDLSTVHPAGIRYNPSVGTYGTIGFWWDGIEQVAYALTQTEQAAYSGNIKAGIWHQHASVVQRSYVYRSIALGALNTLL